MKYFVLVLLFSLRVVFGCDGDCMGCHPKLAAQKDLDANHKILTQCKVCHSKEKLKNVDMGGVCGGDCWQCHDINKVTKANIKVHKELKKCKSCHFDIDRKKEKKIDKPNLMDMIKSRN